MYGFLIYAFQALYVLVVVLMFVKAFLVSVPDANEKAFAAISRVIAVIVAILVFDFVIGAIEDSFGLEGSNGGHLYTITKLITSIF